MILCRDTVISTQRKVFWNKKRRERLFLALLLLFPIAQFIVMYLAVNVNSLFLAFEKYSAGSYAFAGLDNFKKLFSDFRDNNLLIASLRNSGILYFFGLLISTPLNILISFCIYKKIPMSGYFRIILFLPSIISGMVFVLIYKYFVEFGISAIMLRMFNKEISSLLVNGNTAFFMIILYGLWTGFGIGIVLYSNAMSRVPASLVEYGELEGINRFQELWHVILPMIFPTITTFLVTGVAGFFTNQAATFAFFGGDINQNITTLGYYFFVKVVGSGGAANPTQYPYAAAAGIVFTVIAAPITLLVKWLLEKFGPSAEY